MTMTNKPSPSASLRINEVGSRISVKHSKYCSESVIDGSPNSQQCFCGAWITHDKEVQAILDWFTKAVAKERKQAQIEVFNRVFDAQIESESFEESLLAIMKELNKIREELGGKEDE